VRFRDGGLSRKTHCKNGHERATAGRRPGGTCLACDRANKKRYYASKAPTYRHRERAWRRANPEKYARARRNAEYKRKYGITLEQYDTMLAAQGGVCAICGRPPKKNRLAVEHDHGPSKRVRGLTCHFCNRYRIGKNTAVTALKVLSYLESEFDGRNI